ncbi:MAG: type VII toxin-antitoxin system HepT family RNase toxin [Pseudonocardiaceae bacterium]
MRFVTAIEAGVDVAQHVCASQGWGPPRDSGDAVRLLGAHGVLPADLADRLRRAVGFRNVFVHDYAEVDDGIVLGRFANLADLDDFVAVVAAWVVPPRS